MESMFHYKQFEHFVFQGIQSHLLHSNTVYNAQKILEQCLLFCFFVFMTMACTESKIVTIELFNTRCTIKVPG